MGRFSVSVQIQVNYNFTDEFESFTINGNLNSIEDHGGALNYRESYDLACNGAYLSEDSTKYPPSFFYLMGKSCGLIHAWIGYAPWNGSGLTYTKTISGEPVQDDRPLVASWCYRDAVSIPLDPSDPNYGDPNYPQENYYYIERMTSGGLLPPLIKPNWSKDPYSTAVKKRIDYIASFDLNAVNNYGGGIMTSFYFKVGRYKSDPFGGMNEPPIAGNTYDIIDGPVFSWVAGTPTLVADHGTGTVDLKLEDRQ
jgi:hypothetical protein